MDPNSNLSLTLRGRVFLEALKSGLINDVESLESESFDLFLDQISQIITENRAEKSYSFRYFRAMFFGALVGSIIGTVLVKILTQFL